MLNLQYPCIVLSKKVKIRNSVFLKIVKLDKLELVDTFDKFDNFDIWKTQTCIS